VQDARLRLFSVLLLSVASFLSVAGATLTLAWLLLYPAYLKAALRSKAYYLLLPFTGIVALFIQVSGGDGVSYFIRMGVLLLLGFTIFRGWAPGEFLDLSVWLCGTKTGFDLGLAIEMTLQGIDEAARDWSRILTAMKLKGMHPGIRNITSIGFLLIHLRLLRARDQAVLLTTRGYQEGGSCCPEFHTSNRDIIASFCAILILFSVLMPFRDIFILMM
jgi:energy-coupling factor transporter transmembrane protein EcfT